MKPLQFVWDENKNKDNQKKHGVSFEEAQTVFFDDNALEFYDLPHSDREDRFLLLGLSYRFRILLVIYCSRKKDSVIRIISARKATKKEKEEYPGVK